MDEKDSIWNLKERKVKRIAEILAFGLNRSIRRTTGMKSGKGCNTTVQGGKTEAGVSECLEFRRRDGAEVEFEKRIGKIARKRPT